MQDLTKKILEKLPSSWEQLTLRDFIKLSGIEIVETDVLNGVTVGIQNTIKVISILSEATVDSIEDLPMNELAILAKKVDFISIQPAPKKKGLFQWKKVDEITFNDFVTAETLLKDSFDNLPTIIQAFAKNKMSEEEILNLPMTEAVTAFFLLRTDVKISIRNMIRSLKKQMRKPIIKSLWNRIVGNRKLEVQV